MIICICGGRVDVRPVAEVFVVLDQIVEALRKLTADVGPGFSITTIVEGGAQGYDAIGKHWAKARGYAHVPYKIDPELDGYDDQAPKRRNLRMRDQSGMDTCIGFPGGPGTRNMMQIAHDIGCLILDVEFTDDGGVRVDTWPVRETVRHRHLSRTRPNEELR